MTKKEMLEECYGGRDIIKSLRKVIPELIKRLPDDEPITEMKIVRKTAPWISVKEQLPPIQEPILICYKIANLQPVYTC